ncbi:GFA family protein [Roseivivax isoporae]|uniref:CENP-V/GFA domain-containing protein n=1 Tax=Roseivivax isoporae LMG 25204 TaxID=1449351 RepID=X7FCK2_9RHOB|nr:GFA family protein [Roseivivax isoporae]ETX30473.1 hypothetical protein RISW2_12450 [Roseivivax isoporae LMG 25204]
MTRTGSCLCGAVRFAAAELGSFGVCHCSQCQKWTGSALFAVTVPEHALRIEGGDAVRTRRTSDWASRSNCAGCGAPLWYRYDRGVDGAGDYELPVGLLDDANGLVLEREIFTDRKPDCWTLSGDHQRLSEAETHALYGPHVEGA